MIEAGKFVTYKEICSQGEALERILARAESFPLDVDGYDTILLAGCGSSLFLGRFIAGVWRTRLRLNVRAVAASEVMLHPAACFGHAQRVLVLPVSRTGETTETIRAAETARQLVAADLLPVTCYADSTLGRMAHPVLAFPEVSEESVVMTRAFTGMMGAFLHWGAGEVFLSAMPGQISQSLQTQQEVVARLAKTDFSNVVFLGTGPLYPVACEAMLKLKETAACPAEAWQTFEFRHGPRAILDSETLVWLFAGREEFHLLEDVMREFKGFGARLCLCGNRLPPELIQQADDCFAADWPTERTETDALGLLHLAQLYAFFRAVQLGKNPDAPEKLSRVITL